MGVASKLSVSRERIDSNSGSERAKMVCRETENFIVGSTSTVLLGTEVYGTSRPQL